MTFKDAEKVLLVDLALQEVGERGSLEQYKAICICMRNRMKAGWGAGWLEILAAAAEVSAHEARPRVAWTEENRALQRMLREVDELVYGQAYDYAEGGDGGGLSLYQALEGGERIGHLGAQKTQPALYWMFLDRPVRDWFTETIARDHQNHAHRATMGTMMFFS